MAKRGAPPGNNNYSKNRPWAETLRRIAAQSPEKLRRIAEALYAQAEQGDIQAVREIADRLDGKSIQSSEVTINRVTSLEDLPTHELERIAFGSGQDTSEATGGEQGNNAVH